MTIMSADERLERTRAIYAAAGAADRLSVVRE